MTTNSTNTKQNWQFCPWCGNKYVEADTKCIRCFSERMQSQKVRKTPAWKKILYEKQPYDDNYFDDELFLQGLERNTNLVEYEYFDVVKDSSVVTLQITTVAIFCTAVEYLYSNRITLSLLMTLSVAFTVLGFVTHYIIEAKWKVNLHSLVLIFTSAWILSPVLRTLTLPFSEDTILALTVGLFSVHLFLQDYAFVSGLSERYTAPISLNAAIFASVLLVSRLPTVVHAFAIICVAIGLFAMLPILRRSIILYSIKLHLFVTWSSVVIGVGLLFSISTVVGFLYVASIMFVTFVCPYWLARIQKYKNTIHGPWDEAVPTRQQARWKL